MGEPNDSMTQRPNDSTTYAPNDSMSRSATRDAEWFVPRFGPERFRIFVGLLFLPYTGMVISFVVIGSLLADHIYRDRLIAISTIYLLALGVGAHALDAMGGKGARPWGKVFTRSQLRLLAVLSLTASYLIAIYYMVRYVPLLWSMALAEGFFVFAYNLEWWGGRFHSDGWFAFSWGFLPVLSGYMMQTNSISLPALMVGAAMACFSLVEIKASRPYKLLRQRAATLTDDEGVIITRYETILKSISTGVLALGGGLLVWRIAW
jgi:hypothetical protein